MRPSIPPNLVKPFRNPLGAHGRADRKRDARGGAKSSAGTFLVTSLHMNCSDEKLLLCSC